MSKVFVVQSDQGHYFSKHGDWLSGKDASQIFFKKHKDEALNQLIDITIKDVNVRARVLEVALSEKNHPILEIVAESDLHESTDDILENTNEHPDSCELSSAAIG